MGIAHCRGYLRDGRPVRGTRAHGNFFIARFVARARENYFSPRMTTVRWFDLGDIAKSPTVSVVGGAGLKPPFGRQVRSLRKRIHLLHPPSCHFLSDTT
jgi:hypothetical protein